MFILRFIVTLSLLFGSPASFAQSSDVDPRVNMIHKLLTISSGAIQVLNSDNPEVNAEYLKAKNLFSQAQEQFELGNNAQGSALLDQSAKTMFNAIRMATPVKLGADKLMRDYDARKKSVGALNEAFNRIAVEQKQYDARDKTNSQLQELIGNADRLMDAGKYELARVALDRAYQLLKVSIESMRGGQTLIRSLDFATIEEEYQYELERNDSYKILIKLLVDEKSGAEYTQKMATKFAREADLLRSQAEQAALKEQFDQAISLLEQSTRQLVRAIRSAGIYIPG